MCCSLTTFLSVPIHIVAYKFNYIFHFLQVSVWCSLTTFLSVPIHIVAYKFNYFFIFCRYQCAILHADAVLSVSKLWYDAGDDVLVVSRTTHMGSRRKGRKGLEWKLGDSYNLVKILWSTCNWYSIARPWGPYMVGRDWSESWGIVITWLKFSEVLAIDTL